MADDFKYHIDHAGGLVRPAALLEARRGRLDGAELAKVIAKNKPLRTSLRSVTHTTDSTRIGCTANSAAASADGQRSPVMFRKPKNSTTAAAACSRTFVR